MAMLSSQKDYLYLHRFTISILDVRICPKLPSLMKGSGTKELEQLKSFSLKIQEAMSKRVAITEEKRKQYVKQIIYINQRNLPKKVIPVTDFKDEPVIQYEVPVVENTFVFR